MASLGLLRTVVVVALTSGAGIALQSCYARQTPVVDSSTSSTVHEPLAPVVKTPLAPPLNYSPPRSPSSTLTPEPETAGAGEWRASPRWSAIRGDGCIEVKPAEDAAGTLSVENCSNDPGDAPPDAEKFALPPE
jgi:hypothetical protein